LTLAYVSTNASRRRAPQKHLSGGPCSCKSYKPPCKRPLHSHFSAPPSPFIRFQGHIHTTIPKPKLCVVPCVVLRLVVTHGPWKLPEQLSIFVNQFVPARLSRLPRHPRSYRISRRYTRCLARTLCAQFRTRECSVGGNSHEIQWGC
jgi:hypothetical protein